MKLLPCVWCALIVVGLAPVASGQHYLAVKEGNRMGVVVAAKGTRPLVAEGGKVEEFRGGKYALLEGGEYLPVHVAVSLPTLDISGVMNNGVSEVNREFHYYCEFETTFALGNVFVVLLVENQMGEKGLFLYEVGQLEPRRVARFEVTVPMKLESAQGHCELYLFSGGRELFHSLMPAGVMESALTKMVRGRIKGVQNAPAKPLVGPAPEYPKALLKRRVEGSATIAFLIDAEGKISDASVAKASQPEFGEAALAAIRFWRFLPKVENAQPVSTRVQMPFLFSPPEK